MILIKHKIPIYKGTLVIIKVDDLIDIPNEWKPENFDVHGFEAITYSKSATSGYKYFIIAFTENKPKIIAHESFHCVNFIFDHRHIDYDTKNDEHAAYFLEWIFDKCDKFLNNNAK